MTGHRERNMQGHLTRGALDLVSSPDVEQAESAPSRIGALHALAPAGAVPRRLPEPPPLRSVSGIEFSSIYYAAGQDQEGGDFFDLFEAEDDSWELVIGDIAGHGGDASMFSRIACDAARAVAWTSDRPSTVLSAINTRLQPLDRFCTACCVRLRVLPGGAQLAICIGGHPAPLAIRPSGQIDALGEPGMLLGFCNEPPLADAMSWLDRGDTLVMYTDGLLDGCGEHLEVATLHEMLGSCAGRAPTETAAVLDDWIHRADPSPLRDDVLVLVLRVVG